MGEKQVSIIISSYNYGRYLEEAIDSALNQTYCNREVIVVDDGSTDNSRQIIASYGDQIIPVLKANGGQASAFNAGFETSHGDIVCFLDSDDALLPTTVENVVSLFKEEDVAKVHWVLQIINSQGKKTGKIIPPHRLPEGDWRETVMRDGPDSCTWPPTSGNAFARSFLRDVLPIPEEQYKTCPDLYLCMLAPLFGQLRRILKPQGWWRKHGDNHSLCESFDDWLRHGLRLWDYCCGVLCKIAQESGMVVSRERWEANSWLHQLHTATQKLADLIPLADTFILADQDEWRTTEIVAGRRRIPFMERNGQYWGIPPDDKTAISEFERLRQESGANFMVFAWPAFWWFEYYSGFYNHLRSLSECILKNEHLVVFRLHN